MIPYDSRFKKKKQSMEQPKNLPCSFCSKIIPTLGELLEHEEKHEQEFEAKAKKNPNIPYSSINEENEQDENNEEN